MSLFASVVEFNELIEKKDASIFITLLGNKTTISMPFGEQSKLLLRDAVDDPD